MEVDARLLQILAYEKTESFKPWPAVRRFLHCTYIYIYICIYIYIYIFVYLFVWINRSIDRVPNHSPLKMVSRLTQS